MNVNEIKIQAELSNEGMEIKLQYVLRYLNECLQELANQYDTACKRERLEINAKKGELIDLPQRLKAIIEVEKDNIKYKNYDLFNNQIEFYEEGTYRLTYLRYPNKVTTDTEVPEIDEAFHYALIYYIASKEKERMFGEEDSQAPKLMADFLRKAEGANLSILNRNRRIKRVKAPYWG